ncbi:MAG TPA: polymer-forming cytoskeletal protein, partial [Gammaproteobacteria bacterium]|nr:polymer-forming cytoskeletal protein [Gammaproteobacteria bacterium]
KIETEHDIYIDCNYTGEIHTEGLVEIDANARVKANIKCRAITIAGKLEGKVIAAQHITAQANADIKGHLEAPVVEVAQGAILNANVLTDPKKGL